MSNQSLTETHLEGFRGTNPSVWHSGHIGIADSLKLDDGKLVIDYRWLIIDHRLINSDSATFENPIVVENGDILTVQSGEIKIFITNLLDFKFTALEKAGKLEKASRS